MLHGIGKGEGSETTKNEATLFMDVSYLETPNKSNEYWQIFQKHAYFPALCAGLAVNFHSSA